MSARPTRRTLLKGGAATALLGLSLRRQDPAPATDDYRALVCVNLNGGVDGLSFALPRDESEHAPYRAARQDLAVARGAIVPVTPEGGAAYAVGMAPELHELAARFEAGRLAVVANLGPLVRPITRDEYRAGTAPVPAYLFSHSDQSEQWRRARADVAGPTGWCGRVADRLAARNGASPLPLCVSLAGETKLLVGLGTAPYFLSTKGSEPVAALGDDRLRGSLERLLGRDHGHPMERRYADVLRDAIEIDGLLQEAYADAPTFDDLFTAGHPLHDQLRAAARTIAARDALGVRRQVFFVDQVGYDTHEAQDVYLPPLLRGVSTALDAFQTALARLGAEDLVTTFTTSEFGRTLVSNGKGTDHGWGNHQVVLGGAVNGRRVHGELPTLALGGPDDVGEGRLLPRRAVEQHAATLARWFGLDDEELVEVFPNLPRFDAADLGFLRG